MAVDLKPCPMCGRDDSTDNAVQEAAVDLRQVSTPIRMMAYEVQCACGVRGPRDLDAAQAIAAWNRRTAQQSGGPDA